jgi:LacI family transcriptional regulator
MAGKPISLKVLAAHLDLTVSTVSRALNDYSDISVATRDRVKRAAVELGYRPNQTARRLSIGSPETVGYLMPRYSNSIAEPFVAQLLQGLGDALRLRQWDLLVSHAESPKDELKQIERLYQSGRVGGMVISRPVKNDPRIRLMQNLKCPFVVHGRTAKSCDYAWYDIDGKDAFITSVNHLLGMGHSRVAFIGAPLQFEFAQDRLNGYKIAIEAHGLELDDDLIQIADFSDEGGEVSTLQLLDLERPPTAIVCVTDTVAFGCLAALRSRGYEVGTEISVIGYDGINFGVHSNPPLSTMAQPQAHAGRRLGDMIMAVIDGEDPTKHQELQRAHLLRRDTDGPLQPAAVPRNVSNLEDTK